MRVSKWSQRKFHVSLGRNTETHGVVLKAANGELVLTAASAYDVRECEVGTRVQLESHLHGLTLTSGLGRGFSR